MYDANTDLLDRSDRWCWSHMPYMSDQRIVVRLIASFGYVSNCSLLPKVKSTPLGAGIDVACSYIALVLGLLILNLRGGIGGGMVPYRVYWIIGPSRPFASIAIGMSS